MIKFWFTLASIFFSFAIFAQTQNQVHTNLPVDARLYAVYEAEYLERLKTENPFLLQRWNFYLDNTPWFDLPMTIYDLRLDNINLGFFQFFDRVNLKNKIYA